MPRSVIRVNDGVLPWALVTQIGAKGDTGSGGGGAVSSVNGQTGAVTLTAATITETSTKKIMTDTERTKLTGIATGATANDTDANLKNRANHTGALPVAAFTEAVLFVKKAAGAWPARPTNDAARLVVWVGADPSPTVITSGTAGAYADDLHFPTP